MAVSSTEIAAPAAPISLSVLATNSVIRQRAERIGGNGVGSRRSSTGSRGFVGGAGAVAPVITTGGVGVGTTGAAAAGQLSLVFDGTTRSFILRKRPRFLA